MRAATWCALLLLSLLTLIGCAEEKQAVSPAAAVRFDGATTATAANSADAAVPEGAGAAAAAAAARKIIYTVQLDVAVERFDGVQERIESFVRRLPNAYISETTLAGTQGFRRGGQWVIRVPQTGYDGLMTDLRGLGEVVTENKRSEEVTNEYVDLEARLKNKRETERRLLTIQEQRTAALEHILTVEREITRVREEIERIQGRLNRLDDLVGLTTIRLNVMELQAFRRDATPFGETVRNTWNHSVGALTDVGKGLTLFFVGVAPWLPLLTAMVLAIRWGVRRYRRTPSAAAA